MEKISRKSFVKGALGLGLTGVLAGCASSASSTAASASSTAAPAEKKEVYVCRHCPLGCPV